MDAAHAVFLRDFLADQHYASAVGRGWCGPGFNGRPLRAAFSIAPKGPKSLAKGVSPWNVETRILSAPAGAKHVSPRAGLLEHAVARVPGAHAPWLLTLRPLRGSMPKRYISGSMHLHNVGKRGRAELQSSLTFRVNRRPMNHPGYWRFTR